MGFMPPADARGSNPATITSNRACAQRPVAHAKGVVGVVTEFGATTDQRRLTHSAARAITLWPILIVNDEPLKHPLTFTATDQELRAYYLRLAENTGKPVGASTPWQTWIRLMSVHLDEAVYGAGALDRACMIIIDETGFQPIHP
jgi:hypothetical protein